MRNLFTRWGFVAGGDVSSGGGSTTGETHRLTLSPTPDSPQAGSHDHIDHTRHDHPTAPPPTTTPTTTPPPVSVVQELDFFTSRIDETGGGLISATPLELRRGQRPHAGLHRPRSVRHPRIVRAADPPVLLVPAAVDRRDVDWDIRWNGTLGAVVGADARSEATITVRVYEIITTNDGSPARVGPTIFERVIAENGIGAALQGISILEMNDRNTQSVRLPELDLDSFYRLEVELHCSTYVAFSLSATTCGFEGSSDPTRGVIVDDWSITFDNAPAS